MEPTMSPSPELYKRIDFHEPFDPMFGGDPLPPFIPDLTGATIGAIALDCTLRVRLSSGWWIAFEGYPLVIEPGQDPKPVDFISGVPPDDTYLTPQLRALIGETVTGFHVAREEQGHLAIDTPRGRVCVDGRFGGEPWQLYGPAGEVIIGVEWKPVPDLLLRIARVGDSPSQPSGIRHRP
jgi:hypothetical protein